MASPSFFRFSSVGLFLSSLILLTGCSKEEEAAPTVPPVQTLVLGVSSEAPFRRFPGEVAAADSSDMSFEVAGRLIEFPATQGMTVKKGDLLARLDPANFTARADAAQADLTTARTELDRRRQLHQRGVISRSELDQFQRTFDLAEAAMRKAQRALDDTRMTAPFDGRVARTMVNNFQNVQAQQPVLVFQNTSALEVDIQVPETDMAATAQGVTAQNAADLLEAKVEFPSLPGRQFDLELHSFSTEATPSARTFRVTFLLQPPEDQNILPGMTCTVLLRQASRTTAAAVGEGAFLVPLRAIATTDGKSSVWKLNPASMKVFRTEVEMQGLSGDAVTIRSTALAPGDEIVTSGVRFLSEGMKVRRLTTGTP